MRRYIIKAAKTGLVAAGLTLSSLLIAGNEVSVPMADNLHKDTITAVEKKIPVLLVFSAEDCPFCVTVEEEFLKPMMISGDYTDRIMIRKVMLDGHPDAVSFDGEELDVSLMAAQYTVFATPTLVFVDNQGNEIAERLIGVNTLDYYGAYLDKSIDQAKNKMTRKGTLTAEGKRQ